MLKNCRKMLDKVGKNPYNKGEKRERDKKRKEKEK